MFRDPLGGKSDAPVSSAVPYWGGGGGGEAGVVAPEQAAELRRRRHRGGRHADGREARDVPRSAEREVGRAGQLGVAVLAVVVRDREPAVTGVVGPLEPLVRPQLALAL